LHLNISGKEKRAELIRQNIKKLMSRKEETPHNSEMGRTQQDPSQKEAKEKLINDDNKEPNLKEVK